MPRWDVTVYWLPTKQFVRVGHIEADTVEKAKKIYNEQFFCYFIEDKSNKNPIIPEIKEVKA